MNQVVVLCGGKGKRLKPLTNKNPKPMVDIHGKPFLLYLVNQFKHYGVKNFLFLTGYKSKNISDYFSNGSKWGVNINYDKGPIAWNTKKRLYKAKSKIKKNFFLIYSDNFVNYPFHKIKELHVKQRKALTLFLCKKNKGNIKIDKDFKILEYDKLRKKKNLKYVEIGYMVASKEKLFSYIKNDNKDFSSIFPKMIKDNNINSLLSNNEYYSISDLKRLEITKNFFLKKKIILIDRDGLINKKKSTGEYVTSWNQFKFMKKNIDALITLSENKFKFIIITNQAGIGRKKMSLNNLNLIHDKMTKKLKEKGIKILKIYFCPHHWIDNCDCRKPKPGLFFNASSKYKLNLNEIIYIGDDPRDCLAAFNSGCKSLLINDKKKFDEINKLNSPISIKSNIVEAINMIKHFYNKKDDYN